MPTYLQNKKSIYNWIENNRDYYNEKQREKYERNKSTYLKQKKDKYMFNKEATSFRMILID